MRLCVRTDKRKRLQKKNFHKHPSTIFLHNRAYSSNNSSLSNNSARSLKTHPHQYRMSTTAEICHLTTATLTAHCS